MTKGQKLGRRRHEAYGWDLLIATLGKLAQPREAEGIVLCRIIHLVVVYVRRLTEKRQQRAFGQVVTVWRLKVGRHDLSEDGAAAEGLESKGLAGNAVGACHLAYFGFGPGGVLVVSKDTIHFIAQDGDGVVLCVGTQNVENDVRHLDFGLMHGAKVGGCKAAEDKWEVMELVLPLALGVAEDQLEVILGFFVAGALRVDWEEL